MGGSSTSKGGPSTSKGTGNIKNLSSSKKDKSKKKKSQKKNKSLNNTKLQPDERMPMEETEQQSIIGRNKKIDLLFNSVKENTEIANKNVDLVIEREHDLTNLFKATEKMEESAQQFRINATKVKRKQSCLNKYPCFWSCYKHTCCYSKK